LIENIKESVGKPLGIKIQLILNNGFHMKVENIDAILVEKSQITSFLSILD